MIKGLPEKLKKLRLQLGLSQKEVATKLGVSPSIVSGYETGERTPSTEVILGLSYIYKCSTDYLLGKNTDEPTPSLDIDGLSKEQIHALNALIQTMRHP